MPNVVLEAVASGIPVIAPDVGGIGELIRDRDTGLLLTCSGDDIKDADLYVSAIELLLADPTMGHQMTSRALALLEAHHSPRAYSSRAAEIFTTSESSWSCKQFEVV